jgi:peptide chain release factor 3
MRQLSEEGATQVFVPLNNQDIVVGAVGSLQFDLVAFRLKEEYGADCAYDPYPIHTVRWVSSEDPTILQEFRSRLRSQLALDGDNQLALLATSRHNLKLIEDRWPDVRFSSTREHASLA